MFPTTAIAHNVSICLRCQYRLSVQQRTQQKRPRLPLVRLVSRLLTSRASIYQHILQPKDLTLSDVHVTEDQPKSWFAPRPEIFDKYHKAILNIDALGKRGEVLVMADDLTKEEKDNAFEKKEAVKSSVAMDASQIIDKIDGETGMVGSERVAENLENIRLIWTQDRSKAPTVSEFEELAKSLHDGFTKRQLLHYFLSLHHQDSQLELLGAFGTDLYKRSQWTPGSTHFPGDALKRLNDLKAEIQAKKGSNKVLKPFLKYRMISKNKHAIVDRILRQRWHLRTQEDLKVSGELDIWLSRDHLKVLLIHRRDLLRSLAQQYDAKIDVSRSHAVLRVTAEFDTCGEVFKSILYLLENIRMNEVNLSLDAISAGTGEKREEISIRSLLDRVEKVTSTAIKAQFNIRKVNASEGKLRIYHLGPGDEDLEDVRMMLSQTLRRTAPKTSFAFWTGAEKLRNAELILTETEKGLPLVKRGQQWARWSCGTKRKSDSAKKLDGLKRANDTGKANKKGQPKSNDSSSTNLASAPGVREQILPILIGQAKENLLINGSSNPGVSGLPAHRSSLEASSLPDSLWARSPAKETSAVFGHILYPSDSPNRTKTRRKKQKPNLDLRADQTFFNSRREIMTNISGSRSYLQKSGLGDIEKTEELRILLMPAQKSEATEVAGPKIVFPGLMLYIRIDPDTKETSLAEVRLILEETEVDLLLPDEAADIRFLTESFLSPAGEVDPEIEKFLEASSLRVAGNQRLRTPKSLTVLIPAHTIRPFPAASNDSKTANSGPPLGGAAQPGVSVEYTFTSLEHRSVVAGLDADSGFRMQYSIVEAGETGGRRDELRMMFAKQSTKNLNGGCVHGHGDEGEEEPMVIKKRFERFYAAAISLVCK